MTVIKATGVSVGGYFGDCKFHVFPDHEITGHIFNNCVEKKLSHNQKYYDDFHFVFQGRHRTHM